MKITLLCPVCGTIRTPQDNDTSCDICEYCYEKMIKINFEADEFMKGTEKDRPFIDEKVYRKFLYNNPQFNEDKFESRMRKEKEEENEFDKILTNFVPIDKPHCPTCSSTNIDKISGIERGASVLTLGLFSKKINKSFKCKNCGYTW